MKVYLKQIKKFQKYQNKIIFIIKIINYKKINIYITIYRTPQAPAVK